MEFYYLVDRRQWLLLLMKFGSRLSMCSTRWLVQKTRKNKIVTVNTMSTCWICKSWSNLLNDAISLGQFCLVLKLVLFTVRITLRKAPKRRILNWNRGLCVELRKRGLKLLLFYNFLPNFKNVQDKAEENSFYSLQFSTSACPKSSRRVVRTEPRQAKHGRWNKDKL